LMKHLMCLYICTRRFWIFWWSEQQAANSCDACHSAARAVLIRAGQDLVKLDRHMSAKLISEVHCAVEVLHAKCGVVVHVCLSVWLPTPWAMWLQAVNTCSNLSSLDQPACTELQHTYIHTVCQVDAPGATSQTLVSISAGVGWLLPSWAMWSTPGHTWQGSQQTVTKRCDVPIWCWHNQHVV
jgi:hypothetical protein